MENVFYISKKIMETFSDIIIDRICDKIENLVLNNGSTIININELLDNYCSNEQLINSIVITKIDNYIIILSCDEYYKNKYL